ncbi:BatD family protein [Bradyrhizobium tropiciagri]|uniref:BatD family protein n=1 Tax=Bradyrhizobium tropiciagri TaxID=312253 RepID=UPI001BA470F0|nr:BatD family protein [Bradyrhizobium tropiciagri]MBR0896199.1 BatD family protein [Bradyrhizobium tropiciagri]
MRRPLAIATLMFSLVAPCATLAQQSAPEPIVRVTLDPPRVVVGQAATLRIEVLAPNYMTAPPELPGFQVRNAVTRQLRSANESEERDGLTYAGVRFEFAIHPQEPGSYAISGQTITIKYAAEPPATREATLALPRIAFEAFIPDAASALQPFLAARNLSIEQTVSRSSDQLKTGDAVTRTVTVKAEGIPAMLLPPVKFATLDGLKLYPAQPSLQDKTEGRPEVLSSVRVDSAVYMLEKAGDYVLPPVDLHWWNIDAQRIDIAHVDAVTLHVAVNPAARGASSTDTSRVGGSWGALRDVIVDHWQAATLALLALAGLGWLMPLMVRAIVARHRRHRAAYLRSETFAFRALRRAARKGDARAVYFALLDWLQRFEPVAPQHTVEAFRTAAHDAALNDEIGAVERALFSPSPGAAGWSPGQLLRRVGGARRRIRRDAARAARRRGPGQLNPADDRVVSRNRQRRPAR